MILFFVVFLKFPCPALSSILAIFLFLIVLLTFDQLLYSFFCFYFYFLLFLSLHLFQISFYGQNSFCVGIDFPHCPDFILTVYAKQHKAEWQKQWEEGWRQHLHVRPMMDYNTKMLQSKNTYALVPPVGHNVYGCASLCKPIAQRWSKQNDWHVF